MAKTKATHVGECQVCGATQKLPSGMLSLHGYTVQWGFFSGICGGANALPFELDKTLAERMLADVKGRRVATLKQIEGSRDNPKAWMYVNYSTERYGSNDRRWVVCEYRVEDEVYYYLNPVTDKWDRWGSSSLDELLRKATEDRIQRVFEPTLRQFDRYISWATARLKDWAVKPLVAIKSVKEEAKQAVEGRKAERATKALEKKRKAAERAKKLITKYETLVAKEIRDNLTSFENRELYLLDLPSTVSNLLLDLHRKAMTGKPMYREDDPWYKIAEYEEALGAIK